MKSPTARRIDRVSTVEDALIIDEERGSVLETNADRVVLCRIGQAIPQHFEREHVRGVVIRRTQPGRAEQCGAAFGFAENWEAECRRSTRERRTPQLDVAQEATLRSGERVDLGSCVEQAGGPVRLVLSLAPPRDDRDFRMIGVERDRPRFRHVGVRAGAESNAFLTDDLPECVRQPKIIPPFKRSIDECDAYRTELIVDNLRGRG